MHRKASVGGRFIGADAALAAIIWQPPPGVPVRFAVLHVPAAFEEMNKARRMVALQARALASVGGCVVVYDPWGTGDSAGDPAEATFDQWRDDAIAAWAFVRETFPVPGVLWGLRLGALIAASLASERAITPSALILWQPVGSGRTFFNQFLRLAAAAEIARSGGAVPSGKSIREQLDAGAVVDVGGYGVHPALVAGASTLDIDSIGAPGCAVLWLESLPSTPAQASAQAMKTATRWIGGGARVDLRAVVGPSFWATTEIEEAPALIMATTDAVSREIALTGAGPL
jgi:exosortase A-associated hydrolase 2